MALEIVLKMKTILLILSIVITVACGQHQNTGSVIRTNFSNELEEIGYAGLFLYGERSLSDSIWQNGKNQDQLEKLVLNSKCTKYSRFLASEILYDKVDGYPDSSWQHTLAELYTYALELTGVTKSSEQIFLNGNAWGFMYYSKQQGFKDYGSLGNHLVHTGKAAIPFLSKLLDNNASILYEGSKEATIGDSLNYLVKDAAAFYIAELLEIDIVFHKNRKDRNREIKKLAKLLNK